MKVVSVNLGEKREINWKGKMVTTGIFKFPSETPIYLDHEIVKDDVICNREHHGGIDQAVYIYGEQHYAYWQELYPNLDWKYGMFGENITATDFDENQIHVGDTFRLGNTIIEATKSRQPCMKLGVRFNDMKIVKQFWNTSMCGVYFKIIQRGMVTKNDVFERIKHCPDNLTIAEVYAQKRQNKGK